MTTTAYLAPFVEPLALLVRDWQADGKLGEDDLDRALSARARAWVDGVCEASAPIPAEDVESLVALIASQLGGEAALSDLAGGIASNWLARPPVDAILRASRSLVDGPGFVASQAATWLVQAPDWSYRGGRDGFELGLRGPASASPALKALLGALLVRLASTAARSPLDLRVEGLDGGPLVVSARVESSRTSDPVEESRLHRAALVA
ncbi:MAG: hypothetical protein IPK00_21875 [Deltaproteobacteria bacterium]|nr:hypothetical protein [Deltaproteobacteria bacterium]